MCEIEFACWGRILCPTYNCSFDATTRGGGLEKEREKRRDSKKIKRKNN